MNVSRYSNRKNQEKVSVILTRDEAELFRSGDTTTYAAIVSNIDELLATPGVYTQNVAEPALDA
jgi:hypothetical protein